MGDVNNVTGALTTALSDWSATIGGTTAFINKSERIPATTSEETRRIIGWPLAREAAWVFFGEFRSTSSGIAGSVLLVSPQTPPPKLLPTPISFKFPLSSS